MADILEAMECMVEAERVIGIDATYGYSYNFKFDSDRLNLVYDLPALGLTVEEAVHDELKFYERLAPLCINWECPQDDNSMVGIFVFRR